MYQHFILCQLLVLIKMKAHVTVNVTFHVRLIETLCQDCILQVVKAIIS